MAAGLPLAQLLDMNSRTISILLTLLCAVLGYMVFEGRKLNKSLLADNVILVSEIARPKNAHIEIYTGHDRKLVIIVNRTYTHKFNYSCYKGDALKL